MKCNSANLTMNEMMKEIQIECVNWLEEKAGVHSEKKEETIYIKLIVWLWTICLLFMNDKFVYYDQSTIEVL